MAGLPKATFVFCPVSEAMASASAETHSCTFPLVRFVGNPHASAGRIQQQAYRTWAVADWGAKTIDKK